MSKRKVYLAKMFGDFSNLTGEKVDLLNKEIMQILPGPIKAINYMCTCCETSLCGHMSSLCSLCYEYKSTEDVESLGEYFTQLHVVFEVNSEFDFSDRSILVNGSEFIQRGIIMSLNNPDEYIDSEREILIKDGKYHYKTV